MPADRRTVQFAVVQMVCVRWTNQSRGGAGARRRSAIPGASLVPSLDMEGDGVLHMISSDESTAFEVRSETSAIKLPWSPRNVTIDRAPDGLRLVVARLGETDEPIEATLGTDQWLTIRDNVRHSDRETWYEQITCNVACVEDRTPATDLFVRRPPIQIIDQLIALW